MLEAIFKTLAVIGVKFAVLFYKNLRQETKNLVIFNFYNNGIDQEDMFKKRIDFPDIIKDSPLNTQIESARIIMDSFKIQQQVDKSLKKFDRFHENKKIGILKKIDNFPIHNFQYSKTRIKDNYRKWESFITLVNFEKNTFDMRG